MEAFEGVAAAVRWQGATVDFGGAQHAGVPRLMACQLDAKGEGARLLVERGRRAGARDLQNQAPLDLRPAGVALHVVAVFGTIPKREFPRRPGLAPNAG